MELNDNPLYKALINLLEWNVKAFDSLQLSHTVSPTERLLANTGLQQNAVVLMNIKNLVEGKEKKSN